MITAKELIEVLQKLDTDELTKPVHALFVGENGKNVEKPLAGDIGHYNDAIVLGVCI